MGNFACGVARRSINAQDANAKKFIFGEDVNWSHLASGSHVLWHNVWKAKFCKMLSESSTVVQGDTAGSCIDWHSQAQAELLF